MDYPLIFQNVRRLSALSIADMNGIPTDFLESFDQLKVLNLSGNHLAENASLKLLDDINGLEVSFHWKKGFWIFCGSFFFLVFWLRISVTLRNYTNFAYVSTRTAAVTCWHEIEMHAKHIDVTKRKLHFIQGIVVVCNTHTKLNYRHCFNANIPLRGVAV